MLVAVVLSACEAALDVRLVLDRDGGGRLGVSLSADRDLLDRAEAAGADPLGALAAAGRRLEGWEVIDEGLGAADAARAGQGTQGGGRRVELVTPVADAQELQARSAELAEALSAPEVDLLDGFTVTVEGDTVAVRGRAGLVPTDATTEVGLQPDDAVRLLREHDPFRYTVRVRLPGAVVESNATMVPVDGEPGDLVWVVEPGESVLVSAVGERPRERALLVALGATALALLLVVGVSLTRGRGRRHALMSPDAT